VSDLSVEDRRIGGLLWILLPSSVTDKLLYSLEYDCDMKNVVNEKMPGDCDFLHAPVGDKSCHYKKVVTPTKAYTYEGVQYPSSVNVSWEKVAD
jgi:hypothetical protein